MKEHLIQACLPSLPADEAAAVSRRLHELRHDCGCRVGMIVMLGVTASWICYAWLVPANERSWQRTVVIGLVVLVLSAVVGKVLGLALARIRFYVTVRRLRRRAEFLNKQGRSSTKHADVLLSHLNVPINYICE